MYSDLSLFVVINLVSATKENVDMMLYNAKHTVVSLIEENSKRIEVPNGKRNILKGLSKFLSFKRPERTTIVTAESIGKEAH
jgi:hypothetical protein